MASNTFALKTLSVTLCTGAIALFAAIQKPSSFYVLAAVLPVVVFWLMDAKLLQLERLYRALYDDVRKGADIEPFDMRVDRYRASVQPVSRIALSWSVNAIYSTLVALLVIRAKTRQMAVMGLRLTQQGLGFPQAIRGLKQQCGIAKGDCQLGVIGAERFLVDWDLAAGLSLSAWRIEILAQIGKNKPPKPGMESFPPVPEGRERRGIVGRDDFDRDSRWQ